MHMDSRAKRMFEEDQEDEVFTSTEVMLQKTNRPLLPHELLKLLGIQNEIQKANIEFKKNKGPKAIQVPKLSKPLINNLIKSGYRIYLVSPDSNPQLKWYVVKW